MISERTKAALQVNVGTVQRISRPFEGASVAAL
jgi:hypothetical protein